MKQALVIVAMLLLVTPVMAVGTTISAVQGTQFTASDGNKVQPVSITYSSDVNVRAFALDINIANDGNRPNFQGIRGFKTGESNATSPGYGIFPSRFRDFIVVTGPNWVDPNYNPTTAWNEPETTDHNSGMGFPKMIVEMGTLYAGDANKPALSGTLFTFDVNAWGASGTFHLSTAANALRGGVVNADGNTITASYVGTDVVFAPSFCTVPTLTTCAAASGAITGAGFLVGSVTSQNSSTVVTGNVISQNPVGGTQTTCGTNVDYVCSLGLAAPASITYPATSDTGRYTVSFAAVTGATSYAVERSRDGGSTWATDTAYVSGISYLSDEPNTTSNKYRVRAYNATVGYSGYTTGSGVCAVTYCFGDSVAGVAQWKLVGRPRCWCYPRQCHADADGLQEGKSPNQFWVANGDLTILSNAWGKTAAQLYAAPEPNACADFDRNSEGKSPNIVQVGNADLTILSANWNSNPAGNCVPGNKAP